MAIPDEYTFQEIVRKVDNLVVHRASHPIHGKVSIYVPDDTLPSDVAVTVKRSLYQNGIQMRSISQLQLPYVTRALEVSQNPNEPYIITEYTQYNLEELINNGVKLKPKRIFQVFSQTLEAIISLAAEDWPTERLRATQIRLSDAIEGNASFAPLASADPKTSAAMTMTTSVDSRQADAVTVERQKESGAVSRQETRASENIAAGEGLRQGAARTVTLSQAGTAEQLEKERTDVQRNIYVLGGIAYHLMFGKEYHLSDNTAAVNIQELGSRWQKVVNKALSPSLEDRYETYEVMLSDIRKALSRNKRVAFAVTPVFVLLAVVGVLFGYNQYRRHKIMTSEAGQAIESFLNIVNQTNDEFPPPLERPASPVEPNDDAILRPFDEIPTLSEQD